MDNGTQIAGTWFNKDYEKAHPPGWLIEYQPSVSDRGWARWYAELAAARAELAKIATSERRPLTSDGCYLDVTADGCAESRYFIRRTDGRTQDWRQD